MPKKLYSSWKYIERSKSDLNWGKSPNFLHEFFYTLPFPAQYSILGRKLNRKQSPSQPNETKNRSAEAESSL